MKIKGIVYPFVHRGKIRGATSALNEIWTIVDGLEAERIRTKLWSSTLGLSEVLERNAIEDAIEQIDAIIAPTLDFALEFEEIKATLAGGLRDRPHPSLE